MLVHQVADNQYYALKILKKSKIVKLKQVEHTIAEKNIIAAIEHPFIINLHFSFKDNAYLYMGKGFFFQKNNKCMKRPQTSESVSSQNSDD